MIIYGITAINLYTSLFTNETYISNRIGGPWDFIADLLVSTTGLPTIFYEMADMYRPELDPIRHYVEENYIIPLLT